MLKKLLAGVLFIFITFIVIGLFLPADHHVERNINVDRPPSVVFTLLNSYKTFKNWSPWAKRDPQAQFHFSGPDSGVGARLSWSGDPRLVGTGWQQITESLPFERVGMQLDFGEQGTAASYFEIHAIATGSRITWGFDTDVTAGRGVPGALMGKYFGLFLDKWIGGDYELGLASFKQYAERMPASDFANADIELVDAVATQILYVSGSTSQDANDIAQALADAFGEITQFMADNGIQRVGQPMSITRSWDENGYHFDAALPVDKSPVITSGNVKAGLSPSGRAVRIVHKGSYKQMLTSYEQLASFMAAHGLAEGAVSWEHYISDPGNTPPEDIITHIYFQVKTGSGESKLDAMSD